MIPDKRLFTIPEVHQILATHGFSVSMPTIYRWADEGKIERSTLGGSVWVTRDSIVRIVLLSTKP